MIDSSVHNELDFPYWRVPSNTKTLVSVENTWHSKSDCSLLCTALYVCIARLVKVKFKIVTVAYYEKSEFFHW